MATTWNESVILNTNWNNESWTYQIEGPLTPYTMTAVFTSNTTLLAGTKNLSTWWEYKLNRQTFGNCTEKITIFFDSPNTVINSIYSFESEDQNVTFCPPP